MSSEDEYYDSDDQMSVEDSDGDYGFDNTGEEAAQRKVRWLGWAFSCSPWLQGYPAHLLHCTLPCRASIWF
jgi:hypothetical protein